MNSPVIIIGAGRSGTNMLRDILVQIPGYGTWPCDEINYIWRHGNRGFPTDRFLPEMASPSIKTFVVKQFEKRQRASGIKTVVEKTCANSLRVGFVNEIFPNARFIQIVRDGRDVAVSAAKRWNAKLDVGYLMAKAKYVPKSDLFYYASRYFANRVHRITSGKKRLSTWGPKFDGMEDAFRNHSLPVGCAMQWKACVEASEFDFAKIDSDRVHTVRYEEFASRPQVSLKLIGEFLGEQLEPSTIEQLTSRVSNKSVGSWKRELSEEEHSKMKLAIGDCLERLGYE